MYKARPSQLFKQTNVRSRIDLETLQIGTFLTALHRRYEEILLFFGFPLSRCCSLDFD